MATVHMPTIRDAGVVWFQGLGFRPAVWMPPHRHDHVDPPRLVPAPDADMAYLAKYDAPVLGMDDAGYAWGTVLPTPLSAVGQPGGQAITTGHAGILPGTPIHGRPSWPSWPVPQWPTHPPCHCITVPPDLPPIAPVPVSAGTASLLIAALLVLALTRVVTKGFRRLPIPRT